MKLFNILNGDKFIWSTAFLLACVSFLVVFSCAGSMTNVLSHIFHLITGGVLMFVFSKINYKYLTNASYFFFTISIILLLCVLFKPISIHDYHNIVDDRRWIKFFGLTFQPSELAKFSLILLLSRNLSFLNHKEMNFQNHCKYFYFPILLVFGLIFKTNGSTAIIILISALIILVLSDFKIKNIIKFFSLSFIIAISFTLILIYFTSNSRVDTWKNRIMRFFKGENTYQVDTAKKAIASGKWTGLGPGKSVQKNFLPHSSSDFIYAILIEEYGAVSGIMILLLYIGFFVRILAISIRIKMMFPYLLLLGLGTLILFQAFLNIGVSLGVIPVTGQTLPLISRGGSSIWITSIAIGVILNISSLKFKNGLV